MGLAQIAFGRIMVMVVLMLVGGVCAKTGIIDEAANKRLSNFLLLVVSPTVIFMSYQRDFDPALLAGLLKALLLSAVSFVISLGAAHGFYRSRNGKDRSIERFAVVYSNAGFLGIPLIQGVFGTEGVFYLTAYLTMFQLLTWTHGVIIMSGTFTPSQLKGLARSPALIGVCAGFLFFLLGVALPPFLAEPLELVGSMNTPLAMVVAGVSISSANLGHILKNRRIYRLALFRMIAVPGSILAVVGAFGFPPVITGVVVTAAACPVAANLILFAYRYDKDALYASEIFAFSTVASLVTIPILLLFL